MAAGGAGHADSCSENDAASSQPLTEEETTTATAKRLRFTTLTPTTLQQPTPEPPSLPFALPSNHQPRMPPPPATIPFELITEILARLPVKSLLRFRCVCKSWNALISEPQFAKKQFRASAMGLGPTHSARHHLIVSSFDPWHGSLLTDYSLHSVVNSSSATSSRRKWPYVEGEYFRYLAGSCHGMLCIAIGRSCPLLWNPSTGKFKILPSLTKYWQKPGFVAYGFGYDHFGDSYKVVAVVLVLAGGHHVLETEVKVHTLGTDSWRAIHGFPARVASGSGKFVSGTVNWLASDITRSWVIASLDLRTETFQQLLPPDYGADVKVSFNLAALKGCLGIIAHCNMVSDIWLMKDYGNKESWTKLFCFPYLEEHPKYHPRFTRVLYISDEDDEILLEYRSNFTVYNSKSGTFKTPRVQKFRAPIVAEVYAESLISPCC